MFANVLLDTLTFVYLLSKAVLFSYEFAVVLALYGFLQTRDIIHVVT